MRKRIVVLLFVFLLVVVTAGSAIAAKKRSGKSEFPGQPYFTVVGFVNGITGNGGASYIIVGAVNGNRFSKAYIEEGIPMTVQVFSSPETEYRRWTPSGCVPASFDDVDEGDTVSIHGNVVSGAFEGTRVTVDVPLDCCTP
jgi:hypothetical protein